jgi:CTP:molybdopterin cytidylyltransferase MocA
VRIGALVLAAGGGRRFGGVKQLAALAGRPLLSHAVGHVLAVPALSPVVVVLGHQAAAVRAGVPELAAVDVVVAEDWEAGQAASLRRGVAALGDVDAAVVLLGDQPFITPQVIAGVLDAAAPGDDAVRATYGGEPGHPVLLGRRLLRRVDELEGDAGFRWLLEGERVRRFEAGHLADPADIDTREELASR